MKGYWPGWGVAAIGVVDLLLGGSGGPLLVMWASGFLFATVLHRSTHR